MEDRTKSRGTRGSRSLIHPVWSATSCDFPWAGLYVGLAPRIEHVVVARALSPKQLRMITGSIARFGTNETACPLDYYAVRDPSVVRVIPVKRPPLPNGFRHVKLSFKLDSSPKVREIVDQVRREIEPGSAGAPAAFLITIGLPLAEEDRFYQRVIGGHAEQDLSELYTRILELCGPGK
jgi:hypothetical protein